MCRNADCRRGKAQNEGECRAFLRLYGGDLKIRKKGHLIRGALESYVAGFSERGNITVQHLADFDHRCCWRQHWAELIAEVFP